MSLQVYPIMPFFSIKKGLAMSKTLVVDIID